VCVCAARECAHAYVCVNKIHESVRVHTRTQGEIKLFWLTGMMSSKNLANACRMLTDADV